MTPEEKRERNRAHYLSNKEKIKAKSTAWNQANAARVRENHSRWVDSNRDKVRAIGRDYASKNLDKCLANVHRRNARKRAATSPLCTVTAAVIAERFALTKGCAYCGADEDLTADHVVALSDGGLHVPSNLVGACSTCNCKKHARPVESWFRAQPFFSEQRWQRIQQITGNGQLSLI